MTLQTRPISDALGVEIIDDPRRAYSDAEIAEIRALMGRYHLILFRGTQVSREAQIRFASYLAPVLEDNVYIANREDGVQGVGELKFHSDMEFSPIPLAGISLYAEEVHPTSARTIFANTTRAAEQLSPELFAQLDGQKALHRLGYRSTRVNQNDADLPAAWHPVLIQGMWSDKRGVFVAEYQTVRIEGMAESDSDRTLATLQELVSRSENTYAHRWQLHDVIFWDNIALHHARDDIKPDSPTRALRRLTFGDAHSYDYMGFIPRNGAADWRHRATPFAHNLKASSGGM